MPEEAMPPHARGHVGLAVFTATALQEMLRVEGIDPVEMNPAQVSSLVGDNQV
jgi:hypothetical protein